MRASIVVALAAIAGSAQALPQSQQDVSVTLPSSLPTPTFSVSQTFTPITTFQTPENTRPTSLVGVNNGTTYSFSYNVPATAVPAVTKTDLEASLASAGFPVSQQPLSPPTDHLQVNKAAPLAMRSLFSSTLSLGAFVATAIGAGAATLLL